MALINPPSFQEAGSFDAQQTRLPFSTLLNSGGGVVGSGDLAVTALSTPNMSVNVAAGQVWIPGTFAGYSYEGQYYALNDATINVLIPGSDPTNPRIDLIVAQVLDQAYGSASSEWQIVDVEGTPAASPTIPTAPASSIVLAQIAVGAAVSTITSSDITDERVFMGMTVPDKGAQVFNVKAYGATGGGVTDDTATTQAAINACPVGAILLFPAGGTYLLSSTLSFPNDITVVAYGATLKWNGATTVAMCVNPNPINLKWFGGTINGNSINNGPALFGFGASAGMNPASTYLLSCVAENIVFENVYGGAWYANAISNTGTNFNTYLYWKNLRCSKLTGGNNGDMFQLVGQFCNVDVTGFSNSTGAMVFTSAFLKDSKVRSIVTDGGQTPCLEIQPYNGNGPAPFFHNLEIAANGKILLNNGDMATVTTVSDTITIESLEAGDIQIGNSPYDLWDSTTVRGVLMPASNGGSIGFSTVNNVTADLVIDGKNMPSTLGGAGIIAVEGKQGNVTFKSLVVRNILAGAVTDLITIYSSSNLTTFRILSGNMTENVHVPLIASGNVQYLGTASIRGFCGYNPTGPQTAPAIPASGTTQINPFPFDTNVYISGGTVTAITAGNIATPSGLALTTATTGGTLAASTSYSYQVTAVNQRGETLASAVVSLTTGSTTSTNTITATWQSVTGATSYNIYGRVSGSIAKIANVTTPSYTDTGSVAPSGALPSSDTTGITTGLTAGSIFVPAGEGLQITYSAAPTWVWIGN